MRRRDFIAGLGAAAWPVVARAQQPAVPVVGVLNSGTADSNRPQMVAWHQGLQEAGFVEGQSLAVQYRWADGQYDRLPALATDLVSRRVAAIAAGGPPAALAAKAATSTTPIVFTSGGDAVKLGLVTSLSRPGGNMTGISFLIDELAAKRLGLLRDLAPQVGAMAILVNPTFADSSDQLRGAQEAARAARVQLHIINVTTDRDFEPAFARVAELRVGALLVNGDPFLFSRREQIVALVARHGLPAIYNTREFATAGGLMSYDTSLVEVYHQAGIYLGRILRGANPGDLPILQPTKFEFVLNRKTAKTLGLAIPSGVLAIADEVIE